ncbi:bifunctional 4-hydroxy-2-oxoglutarate aldolase/2-dehydro-3-deoxy-phosphogluconate aldolase [Specibacter sp. RAF43]|uniref:bifunctional 4-hydroxy-2-oxoglutarate aldolase/2-dehydro-3-deoxy-phosphogluconate aldolase n=1 Tax=Specibacter sp. RAF43 TaxID=3233057 RepID=UPI003F9E3C40
MTATEEPARVRPSAALLAAPVIAVLRAGHAAEYAPVVATLTQAGITSIELTLSTPGTLEHLGGLRRNLPEGAEIGVGTVTTAAQAAAAIAAGADFLVTPVTDLAIITVARSAAVPVYPGGLTPTELHAGWSAGATAVKVFPAAVVGSGYLRQLRGPFPDIDVVPSGGVELSEIPGWMKAGALAVSLGGPLLGDAFKGGSEVSLRERAERALELARGSQVPR